MKTDVTAEVGADDVRTGVFEQFADRIADDASVEVADVQNFERVGVAEFADDGFILVCVGFDFVFKVFR